MRFFNRFKWYRKWKGGTWYRRFSPAVDFAGYHKTEWIDYDPLLGINDIILDTENYD